MLLLLDNSDIGHFAEDALAASKGPAADEGLSPTPQEAHLIPVWVIPQLFIQETTAYLLCSVTAVELGRIRRA